MIHVTIDAPVVRPLNAPEKKVYQMLKEGKTPIEIAKVLRMPFYYKSAGNRYDVPNPSVQGIIMSIREKGWTLPNEEDKKMPKIKLSVEDKRNIVTLCNMGATATEVAEKYGISKGTVWNLVSQWKKHGDNSFTENAENTEIENEPATVGAVTDSEEESVVTNISEPIVPDIAENVKSDIEPVEVREPVLDKAAVPEAVFEAVNRYRDELRKDIAEHKLYIAALESQLAELAAFVERAKT